MKDTSNFFAILPAPVRYNPRLSPRSVLMYALLTSLAQADGEAFASNEYLSDVLKTSEPTVKRMLRELSAERYVFIRYEYKDGTKEIARRLIRITELPLLLDIPNTQALYAVIPTHVLCNSALSPQAKLLYAEISAATPTDGYCSKPATFFADLLHTSEPTVRRWIKELKDADALRVEMEYKGDSKEIARRRIYLTAAADIVEKRAKLSGDGSDEDNSSIPPNTPPATNIPENGQIRGMLIFDPTFEKPRKLKRKHRWQGKKRKKATEILRL